MSKAKFTRVYSTWQRTSKREGAQGRGISFTRVHSTRQRTSKREAARGRGISFPAMTSLRKAKRALDEDRTTSAEQPQDGLKFIERHPRRHRNVNRKLQHFLLGGFTGCYLFRPWNFCFINTTKNVDVDELPSIVRDRGNARHGLPS